MNCVTGTEQSGRGWAGLITLPPQAKVHSDDFKLQINARWGCAFGLAAAPGCGGGDEDGDLNSGFCPVLKKLGQMPSRAPSVTDSWLPGMMGLCLRCQPAGTPTKSGWGVGADFDRSWTKKNVFKWSAETFHVMKMNTATTSLSRWRPEMILLWVPLIGFCKWLPPAGGWKDESPASHSFCDPSDEDLERFYFC